MSKSVYLSPSTQEKNVGVGNYGTEEKMMNKVADALERVLKGHGLTVYRNKPEMLLAQVVTDSNNKKPDIHFAIHSNASNGKARGCEVYCHKFGGEAEKLARAIYTELSPLTPTSDRGVMEGYNHFGTGKPLYELAKTNAPAALIEIAYHDNSEDAKWITYNIEEIGIALAKGVLKYFGIEHISENHEIGQAVKLMKEKGIISDTDYWVNNAIAGKTVKGDYVAILIKRAAEILSK
ncbi:N-acetylmuramoyl-L-alanine amidase [Ruminiclostridium sufflavum DSM 19573]|uniref:N-acetylmuramoyl-L-alanine amidase n=1 Tax=Ruminiclostridium sufflavum DSM 19573 TaxID=1121337 RepID=A0A318XIM4_9FIRM|nr:N-acetylmuramoyl-L-alanine amidase [Ruminiclostridium sufflavum]PYG84970.1 N-acetylmuramoyl-L-alanine amidase [Ruminiclostridium sufflavum DSM 19573]